MKAIRYITAMATTIRKIKNHKSNKTSILDQVLSDSLFDITTTTITNNNDAQVEKDPLASQVWRMYTKAKDTLPNSSRMENLTWRMMAMTLLTKKKKEKNECKEEEMMDIDNDNDQNNITTTTITTPPIADDTTTLLSSSAPPYTMTDLFNDREQLQQQQQQQQQLQMGHNVMISGSTRAINNNTNISNASRFTPIKRHIVGCEQTVDINSITIPSIVDEDDEIEEAEDDHYSVENIFMSHSVPSVSYFMPRHNAMSNTSFPALTTSYQNLLLEDHQFNDMTSSSSSTSHPTSPLETVSIPHAGSLSFEEILNIYYNNSLAKDIPTPQHQQTPSPPSTNSEYEEEEKDKEEEEEEVKVEKAKEKVYIKPAIRTGSNKYKRTKTTVTNTATTNTQQITQCSNCETTATPLWRRDPQGKPLCNACGLFLKLHGSVRPLSLKTDIIKKRNRNNSTSGHSHVNTPHRTTSKAYSKKHQNRQSIDTIRDTKQSIERRNIVHIAPQHRTSLSDHQPLLLSPKRQPHRSYTLPNSTTSATNTIIKHHPSPPMTLQHHSSSSFISSSPTVATTTTSTTQFPSPITTNIVNNQQHQQTAVTSATSVAINAILQSVGIHLDNLPVELLPLIASAANHHAANKKREQEEKITIMFQIEICASV
ncbi:MAG: hypothetical protein EXX96DRAFT_604972 [Benjaminiella poitrasii]|nr:MAG: hypothetical protein EXX96DRAFT_604972 [Benjaminiella poitrasii]